MKLKNWKEIFKGKASAGLLVTGVMAVAVVTVITLSKGTKTEEPPQIDLNESGSLNQANNNDNDRLLEFDDYAGKLPSVGEDSIHNEVNITGPGALDVAQNDKDNKPDTKPQPTPELKTEDITENNNEENQQVASAEDNQLEGSNESLAQENNTQVAENNSPTQPNSEKENIQEVSGVTVESLSFHLEDGIAWPVHGEIILPFSIDHAVYHKTLNQFKVNPALLISCEPGTQILAPVRGIITDITETPQTGVTITMAVGDDYFLVYGQMENSELAIGNVLEVGDTIGIVAKATKYYTLEGNHLYFQMLHEKEAVDPTQYLKTE